MHRVLLFSDESAYSMVGILLNPFLARLDVHYASFSAGVYVLSSVSLLCASVD